MKIRLRYFASIREGMGVSEETVEVPDEVGTVGDLWSHLLGRGSPWDRALASGRGIRVACQFRVATLKTPVTEGDEVAFFPPVTGG